MNMNTTNLPGRASDAGPSLSEDADTRDWLDLAMAAGEAIERVTVGQSGGTQRRNELLDAIDLINLALERL